MIHKVVSSDREPVIIESDDDLLKFLKAAQTSKLVMTKHGIINPSFVVKIIPHRELNNQLANTLRMKEIRGNEMVPQFTYEQALERTVGVSVYAKLLSGKMQLGETKQLS